VAATFNPTLVNGCTAASQSGHTFVGTYPN
jgi:hypothetical protein